MQKLLFTFFTLFIISQVSAQVENMQANRHFSRTRAENLSSQFIKLFEPVAEQPRKDGAKSLKLNRELLSSIWEREPLNLSIVLPLPNGKTESLQFVKTSIASEDFSVRTSDGRKFFGKEYLGLHYQLKTKENKRLGGISFREDGIVGMISHENGNYNIGEGQNGKGDYVISDDSKIDFPGWDCGTDDNVDFDTKEKKKISLERVAVATASSCKTVRISFEADYDLYIRSSNNITTATNFVTSLFNIVKQVYMNEQITLQISSIFVWTTVDPYASLTNTFTILNNFATNRPAAQINGELTHFLDCRSSSLGGIAYIGALCNSVTRHGFSSIYYSYQSLPTFSWSVFCISHELGHNFGARHTHWCGWTLPNGTTGRIDSCFAGEGSCGAITKPTKGTIMSYCYNTNGGVDMNLGFGPLPGKSIRDRLNAATCISGNGCLRIPTLSVDSVINLDKNYSIKLSIPANHNATSWSVLEGSTVLQTGALSTQTAVVITIPVSNKPNGIYTYSSTLSSGSANSASVVLSVNVAVPAITISSGQCTAGNLQAWYDVNGKVNFKFKLSPTCTTYNVQMCRYNLTNPLITPSIGALPVACGLRNNMSAYKPTTTERAVDLIERIANPQPSGAITTGFGSYWYSIDVLCSGSGCTTTNRTRTYIFVPGI